MPFLTWNTTQPKPNSFDVSRSTHRMLSGSKWTRIEGVDNAAYSSRKDSSSAGIIVASLSLVRAEYVFRRLPFTGTYLSRRVFNSWSALVSYT